HPIFKRKEPSVFFFLGLVLLSSVLLLSHSIINDGRSLWCAVFFVTKMKVCFLTSLATSITVYRLSPWHPLANYPGPTLAKISKWWMVYWVGKGKRHLLLQSLHAQYGPWLRIGPNEISINQSAAIKPVYGQMFRAPYYHGAPQDADALITTLDRTEHANRLVAWNKAFAADSLRNFRALAETRTAQVVDILRKESLNPVNLSHWISLWGMDIMGDMSFSGGFETLVAGKDTEGWMEILSIGTQFVAALGQVPWMSDVIACLPQPGPIVTFHKFASQKVVSTKVQSGTIKQDILGIIQDEASGGPPLSHQEATADASFMVVAGSDTVSQALTSFFRYVVGDISVQNCLREEINSTFDVGDDYDSVKLAKLPYLDACIHETLRILPPVGPGPPRYSGDGGPVTSRYIPAGVTVACPTYTLHRDPQNFKHPDVFMPERWLHGSTISPHVQEAFIPFSYGLGVCIGKPVALHNMKLFAARVLQSFELSFAEGFDPVKFDQSYRELNLWLHDPLMINMKGI
ncbi:cytochrome P450, partial [Collybia nuda]